MTDIGFGVIGLGRMGMLHAQHLRESIPGARLVAAAVASQDRSAATALAPCPLLDSAEALVQHPDVEAVLIASSSNAHAAHVALAAAAPKAVFCEKPLADSVAGAERAVQAVEIAGIPFQIGFQRRYDPGYARARELIAAGAIGDCELFRGISSDHMPPLDYLRTSGGLFWDLGVHDFDAARFLMDEVVAVQAVGAIKIEPRLAEFGDIDYGVVTLCFANRGLGVVQNSWRAPWGYEIRAEVCGSQGRVVTELDEKVPLHLYGEQGIVAERHHLFLERFREAYQRELQAFVNALHTGTRPTPDVRDGLKALQIAAAATQSQREAGIEDGSGRWIKVAR